MVPGPEGAGGVMREGRAGFVILPDVVVGECSFKDGQKLITPSIKGPVKAWGRQDGAVRVFEGFEACDVLLSLLSRGPRPPSNHHVQSREREEEANARRLRDETDQLMNALGDAAGSFHEATQLVQASRRISFETVRKPSALDHKLYTPLGNCLPGRPSQRVHPFRPRTEK